MKLTEVKSIIKKLIEEQFRGAPGGTTAFGKGTNTFRKDAQRFRYDFKTATRNGIIYPSLDPSIFELKYPDTDIKGKIKQY